MTDKLERIERATTDLLVAVARLESKAEANSSILAEHMRRTEANEKLIALTRQELHTNRRDFDKIVNKGLGMFAAGSVLIPVIYSLLSKFF